MLLPNITGAVENSSFLKYRRDAIFTRNSHRDHPFHSNHITDDISETAAIPDEQKPHKKEFPLFASALRFRSNALKLRVTSPMVIAEVASVKWNVARPCACGK